MPSSYKKSKKPKNKKSGMQELGEGIKFMFHAFKKIKGRSK